MTTDDIINGVIRREGSTFTNDPLDPGGPTKYGITLQTLKDYHHDDAVTADEISVLSMDEARAIYREMFVERPGFLGVRDDRLRAFLVDWGVNSGPRTSIKALQRRCGLTPDGIMGPVTLRFANNSPLPELYDALVNDRAQFYADIVSRNPSQGRFLQGWLNRNNEFRNVEWA